MQKILGTFAIMIAVVVGSSAQALAQEGQGQKNKGGDKAASAGTAKVKVYDFSGDTIEGDLIKPEGTTVDARDFAKHSSLIRIRQHFIPEILKSAEDL